MFKNEYFKIFLISIIFSLSVLIVLPKILINVDNFLLTINSEIGGYEFKLPGKDGEKTLSFKDFKSGLDVGGGSRITFKIDNSSPEVREKIIAITEKRLTSSGIPDFEVTASDEESDVINVDIPSYVSTDRVAVLVSGNGSLNFKKLKSSEEWNSSDISKYVLDQTLWEDSGISEKDISSVYAYLNTSGLSSMKITFTKEGNKKFRDLAKESINRPVAIYINNLPYPFSLSLLSKEVALDSGPSVSFSGGFKKEAAEDFVIQRNTPFPEVVTYVNSQNVAPKIGNDFVSRYGIAFLVGLALSVVFLTFRFGTLGIWHGVSLLYSLVFFSALIKAFSITVDISAIIALVTLVFLLSDFGYSILSRLKTNVSKDKPFELVFYQAFEKDRYILYTPAVFIFVLMMVLYPFNIGRSGPFVLLVTISMFILIFFYPFLLRAFGEVFGGKRK